MILVSSQNEIYNKGKKEREHLLVDRTCMFHLLRRIKNEPTSKRNKSERFISEAKI